MTWIDKILPIITLILGFALSEFGKYFSNRKNDRKKLKKLLFNLLELRWLLNQEINLNKKISDYVDRLEIKITEKFGPESANGAEHFKPILTKIIAESIVKPDRINEIEKNIDMTIIELSEIYPIFAYELSGRYKIKEKLENTENYFKNASRQFGEFPTEIKNWIEPKISNELISDFDDYIKAIAKKIGRKTNKNIIKKLKPEKEKDTTELDEFIEEYMAEIEKTMPNNI